MGKIRNSDIVNKHFDSIIKDVKKGLTTTEVLIKYNISKYTFYKEITQSQRTLLSEAQVCTTMYGVGYYK